MFDVFQDIEKLKEMLYLRDVGCWGLRPLSIKFNCPTSLIQKYLRIHEIPQPKKIKVGSFSKRNPINNIDFDGSVINLGDCYAETTRRAVKIDSTKYAKNMKTYEKGVKIQIR